MEPPLVRNKAIVRVGKRAAETLCWLYSNEFDFQVSVALLFVRRACLPLNKHFASETLSKCLSMRGHCCEWRWNPTAKLFASGAVG